MRSTVVDSFEALPDKAIHFEHELREWTEHLR